MNAQYYIVENGAQAGPFMLEELEAHGLTPDTLVWRAGMADWVKASELPETARIVIPEPPAAQAQAGKLWFAMINGRQEGPAPFAELYAEGLNADTPVWTEGMPDWKTVRQIPELLDQLKEISNPAGSSYYGKGGTRGSAYNGRYGTPPSDNEPPYARRRDYPAGGYGGDGLRGRRNWMPWAIVATIASLLFSCIGLIFGVLAISNANKANRFYEHGLDAMGDHSNDMARTMTIISLVISAIGLLGSLFFFTYLPDSLADRLSPFMSI